MKFWFAIVLSTACLCAQQQDSIIVTGTAEPIPLAEADRDVSSIQVPEQQQPLYDSWFDLLSLDPSLDLQERAPGGFMADLSIRGATFEQTLVLLNGMRLDDVQTGHFNLDLPIPLEMISGMEILKGSGSTLYGSDAIGGVVNVIAQPLDQDELRLIAGGGNFGFNEQHAIASFGGGWWREELAGARDFSTGFMPDRDYRNLALSSLSQLKSRLGSGSILFAYSDRPYGADQFYGPYPSWERIKSWFLSAHQNLGDKTEASFAYRRHTDLFVLFRDDPQIYTNRHIEDTWQGDLRRHDNLPLHGVISYGVEGLSEAIHSTNLGIHSRTRGSGYVFYDLRSVRRYSLSLGIREEVYGAHQVATTPTASGAVWFSSRFKLRASASSAFRLPSFTDLYYSDPSNLGNPNLKPESAISYEAGQDAYLRRNLRAFVTVFQRHDKNVIDYVAPPGGTVYTATNFDNLTFTGVETGVAWDPHSGQHIAVTFSGLHGVNGSPDIEEAKYTFNYPVESGLMEWRGSIGKRVIGRTRLGVVERLERNPYAVWDASASYATGRVRPFLQLTNITNADYQELPGIVMPSRAIVGGCEFYVFGGR
jgi:iron complex outermembrane recepter protein